MKFNRLICSIILIGMLTACPETTSTQREYSDYRDQCRLMAEQRGGVQPGQLDGNGSTNNARQKSLLIAFKDCMSHHGWSVTGPEKGDEIKNPPLEGLAIAVAPLQAPPNAPENIEARRANECGYARQNIHHSSNARALAKACDIECANKKRLSPDMPTPGACAK